MTIEVNTPEQLVAERPAIILDRKEVQMLQLHIENIPRREIVKILNVNLYHLSQMRLRIAASFGESEPQRGVMKAIIALVVEGHLKTDHLVDTPTEELTPFEEKVVILVAQGFTNREIGMRIGNFMGDIEDVVQSINRKWGVHNRYMITAKVAMIAKERGKLQAGELNIQVVNKDDY